MKILIFSDQYYPLGGGIEQYLKGLSIELVKNGHEICNLTRTIESTDENETMDGVKVIRSPLMLNAIREPGEVLSNWQKILPIVREIGPDIIYANHHTSLAGITIAKELNIPVIYCCHGWGLLCPLKIRLIKPGTEEALCMNERSAANCSACGKAKGWAIPPSPEETRKVIKDELFSANNTGLKHRIKLVLNYISSFTASPGSGSSGSELVQLIKRYDGYQEILDSADNIVSLSNMFSSFFPKVKTHVIPLGLDTGFFSPVDPAPSLKEYNITLPYILVTSRIHHNKGQYVAVEALKHLPENIKLVLAGNSRLFGGEKFEDNMHTQEVREIIEKNNLEERIIFTGFIDPSELRELYSGAIATVVPSVWAEPYGYVTLEAMSCECPVIATHNSGSAEAVTNGIDGYIVSRISPEEIATAVQNIMPNRDMMGKKAREKMLAENCWEHIGKRVIDLFDQTINKRKIN